MRSSGAAAGGWCHTLQLAAMSASGENAQKMLRSLWQVYRDTCVCGRMCPDLPAFKSLVVQVAPAAVDLIQGEACAVDDACRGQDLDLLQREGAGWMVPLLCVRVHAVATRGPGWEETREGLQRRGVRVGLAGCLPRAARLVWQLRSLERWIRRESRRHPPAAALPLVFAWLSCNVSGCHASNEELALLYSNMASQRWQVLSAACLVSHHLCRHQRDPGARELLRVLHAGARAVLQSGGCEVLRVRDELLCALHLWCPLKSNRSLRAAIDELSRLYLRGVDEELPEVVVDPSKSKTCSRAGGVLRALGRCAWF